MATVQADGYLERKLLRAGFKLDLDSQRWVNRFGYSFGMDGVAWANLSKKNTLLASSQIFRVKQAARRARTRAEFVCDLLFGRRTSKRGIRR